MGTIDADFLQVTPIATMVVAAGRRAGEIRLARGPVAASCLDNSRPVACQFTLC